ncbi:hypothetical protein [Pedobacter foliorum]|uniref:hypothetical protein n=1 Tax=Pedobacter foliorum TaxID=2739058 RepID=UPI00156740A3|nr:hypothetical protein [Pedobacter foliorum]NRF38438.1 hypothetical protein [Pedobacter foliorum]
MIKIPHLTTLLSLILLLTSYGCNTPKEEKKVVKKLSFDSIIGIRYQEVKRRFSNGLSFNEMGFQQEPSWIIQFKSNDTVMAYSPQKKKMQPFFLMFDHGDVYNFANEYFRIKKISKDSLVFQRLHLQKKEISKDIRSDVNITYYSDNYLKNVLKTTAEELQKPSKADTLYVQWLSARSNRNPQNLDSAFAGRQPVEFTPVSKLIKVKKITTIDPFKGRTLSYDYLFPYYRIDIDKAYKDFAYEFNVLVNANGKMYLTTFGNVLPEHKEARKKSLEAIISVYLQNLLAVTPGKTLGIPHSSEIKLVVQGKKTNK